MNRTENGAYQKPLEFSIFDTAQKFAHALGSSHGFGTFSLDTIESAEIPVATAVMQKEEVEDVYLTPGGSTSTFSVLEGDPSDFIMDLPLSADIREMDDQGWLYSLHDASMFDITGDMRNVDRNDALTTEIRTDTAWSKEMDDFLNIPLTDPINMDLGPAAVFSNSAPNMAGDEQLYTDIFSSGHSFEDIIDGLGTMAMTQPLPHDHMISTTAQALWLPELLTTSSSPDLPISPDNSNDPAEDCKPQVSQLTSSTSSSPLSVQPMVSSPSSTTSVLETLLKTAADSLPPTPAASTPLPPTPAASSPRSSKPKSTMLLFGKHENDIMAKLKGVKKSEKKSMKKRLVGMPVEEFNSLLEQSNLSEIEVAFMKEWRRRGKNKTAAQFARKKRREEMSGLDVEVLHLKKLTNEMQQKYEQLLAQVTTYKTKTLQLEDELLLHHTSRSSIARQHSLHPLSSDVFLVPRSNSHAPISVQ